MPNRKWTINPINKQWYEPFRTPFQVHTWMVWGPTVRTHNVWFPVAAIAAMLGKNNEINRAMRNGYKLGITFRATSLTWPKQVLQARRWTDGSLHFDEFSLLNFLKGFRPW